MPSMNCIHSLPSMYFGNPGSVISNWSIWYLAKTAWNIFSAAKHKSVWNKNTERLNQIQTNAKQQLVQSFSWWHFYKCNLLIKNGGVYDIKANWNWSFTFFNKSVGTFQHTTRGCKCCFHRGSQGTSFNTKLSNL